MEREQFVSRYIDMLSCKYTAYCWHFDGDMELMDTNCPGAKWWDGFFGFIGYKQAVRSHFADSTMPFIIGDSFGILWGCVRDPSTEHVFILGPVLHSECSTKEIREFFRASKVEEYGRQLGLDDRETRQRMKDELERLPLVMILEFSGDVMMLHCCVTGEVIHRGDLVWRREKAQSRPPQTVGQKDRNRTYSFAQALSRAVEEGDLSYQTLLDQAPQVSSGIPLRSNDPLLQAKLSVFTFTVRCGDAAIRGGLTPDQAYSLGDSYNQMIMDAATLADLPAISHAMYADFIRAVYQHNKNPRHSKHIDRCIRYIADNIEKDIRLPELAEYVGYAGYYLTRKFKQEVGVSVKDYIKSAKIEHAKLLLLTSQEPVSRIAEQMGYHSSSYFVQQFREVTGSTPDQWRQDNSLSI